MIGSVLRRSATLLATLAFFAFSFGQVKLKPTNGQFAPLTTKRISCEVNLNGPVAEITQTWVFTNPFAKEQQFEADLDLSVTSGHVLTGFAYWFGEEKVPAFIVSKKRAAQIYASITTLRRDPALIEKVGKNRFRLRLSPILGGQDLKVELRSVAALTGGLLRLQFPSDVRRPLDTFSLKIEGIGHSKKHRVFNSWKLPIQNSSIQFARTKYRPQTEFRLTQVERTTGWWADAWGADSGSKVGTFAATVQPLGRTSLPRPKLSGRNVSAVHYARRPGGAWQITGRYGSEGPLKISVAGRTRSVMLGMSKQEDHPALKLWAQDEIEALGTSDKVRRKVIAISARHGLPSHFTSWLAIPKVERQNFKWDIQNSLIDEIQDEMVTLSVDGLTSSREFKDLEQELSQALKGDARRANPWLSCFYRSSWALKEAYATEVLTENNPKKLKNLVATYEYLQKLGSPPRPVPLESAFGEAMHSAVRTLGDRWLSGNLPHAKLVTAINRARPFFVDNYPTKSAEDYFRAVELGSTLEASSKRITLLKLDPDRPIDVSADRQMLQRAKFAYPKWAVEHEVLGKTQALQTWLIEGIHGTSADRRDDLWFWTTMDSKSLNQLLARVRATLKPAKRVFSISEIESAMLNSSFEGIGLRDLSAIREAKTKLSDAVVPTATRAIAKEHRFSSQFEPKMFERLLWRELEEYSRLYQASVRDFSAIAALERDFEFLSRSANIGDWRVRRYEDLGQYRDWNAYPEATERAQFLKSLRGEKGAAPLVDAEGRFKEAIRRATYVKHDPNVRVDVLKADYQYEQLIQTPQTPERDLKVAELNKRREALRARLGDPILYVNAPKSSRAVTALLPDGELKLLNWNESRQQWELRFDVPGYVKDGKYTIKVTVVTAEGKREILNFQYDVDTDAPIAQWKWSQNPSGGWLLTVETCSDVARIEAFLAEKRLSLVKMGPGRFELRLDRPAPLMLAITDQAHNRSALEVTPQ